MIEAVRQRIVSDKDAVQSFRCGHLTGLDAIKLVFSMREKQAIQSMRVSLRLGERLLPNTIEKLGNGYYDGRSLDSIVCEASRLLGERYALYHAIALANTPSSRILSRDGLYALPCFVMRDIDSCDPRFVCYNELFPKSDSKSWVPRTREDVQRFLESSSRNGVADSRLCSYDLDMVISYLVRRGSL